MSVPYPAQPSATKTNVLAIVSLVAGAISWVMLPLVAGVVAVVLGHLARGQIRRTGEEGNGLAIGGLVLGYLNIVFCLLMIALMIALFIIFPVDETP
jgi:Domain of unknown function (DUF4190)